MCGHHVSVRWGRCSLDMLRSVLFRWRCAAKVVAETWTRNKKTGAKRIFRKKNGKNSERRMREKSEMEKRKRKTERSRIDSFRTKRTTANKMTKKRKRSPRRWRNGNIPVMLSLRPPTIYFVSFNLFHFFPFNESLKNRYLIEFGTDIRPFIILSVVFPLFATYLSSYLLPDRTPSRNGVRCSVMCPKTLSTPSTLRECTRHDAYVVQLIV